MTDREAPDAAVNIWLAVGILLFVIGGALIIMGYMQDPSVETSQYLPGSLPDTEGSFSTSRVVNFQKLARQLMTVIAGAAFLVSGSVFIARRP